ncbi:uncharacterized protein LOC143884842 [Tasmannia lanceolata]|uniref:uncharacterized protein LOC143884842 n=1 Tax=Tasmannia lanceolata TaxID=3420 RepID=UPI004062D831
MTRVSRIMDLNLYLGLPRSPIRHGTDLGSDLALGSILLSGEENCVSTDMPGFTEALDSHAPYSPTHSSNTPNQQSVEPLGAEENLHFEDRSHSPRTSHPFFSPSVQTSNEPLVHEASSHLGYSPYSPSYIPLSPARQTSVEPLGLNIDEPSVHTSNEPLVHEGSSHLGYSPNSPSYIPLSPATQTSAEPLGLNIDDPAEYVPYSPSYAPVTPTVLISREDTVNEGTNHAEYVPYPPSYAPVLLPLQVNEPFVLQDGDSYVPYSSSYVPVSGTTQVHDDNFNGQNLLSSAAFHPHLPTVQTSEALMPDGASQGELLQFPEVRFQRLIESNHRWPVRRFRSTVHFRSEPDSTTSRTDHVFQDIMASERSVEASGSHKVSAKGHGTEDVEEAAMEQSSGPANFECNVCLDVANEPVVTSCGHLFCWPCLYQWLHLHCDYKECPVCKGEVTESNITPIYGRGSSETRVEKKGGEDGDSSLKVPPRPHGRRLESLRHGLFRPLSRRRLQEEISSFRRIVAEEIRNENRVEGHEPSLEGIFDDANRSVLSSLRAARRLLRLRSSAIGLNSGGGGSSRNTTELASNSQTGNSRVEDLNRVQSSTPLLDDGIDFWHRLALYSDPPTTGVIERMPNNRNHPGTSTSVNPQNNETPHVEGSRGATQASDQASASSTMAIIQGDGVLNATYDPNGVGSSRSLRRRRRNGASSSLDVDGGVHHASKRRRLN